MNAIRTRTRLLGIRCAGVLCLIATASVWGQSAEQVRSAQEFEAAKAANQVTAALAAGDRAVRLAQSEPGDRQVQIDLLRSVAEFAAQAARPETAVGYLQQALALQATESGADAPDLLPVLSTLADQWIALKRYAEAETTLQRALTIERATYGEGHPNIRVSLQKLRTVYIATGNADALAHVDSELAPSAARTRAFGTPNGGTPSRYNASSGFATVRVFYGTNRARTGNAAPADFYGKLRGDLQYGYLDVTVPKTHKIAELESAQWTDFSFMVNVAADKKRFVVLDKVIPLSQQLFVENLRQEIAKAPSHDVFIFVHGYNNTFEDSARRAAQLAYDLNFDGTPILYSWPSQASTTAYTVDEAVTPISGVRMSEFLNTVVTQSGASRIHLIAHSMGNRVLIDALQAFLAKKAPNQRRNLFGQIVFTAPDVDRDYFAAAFDSLQGQRIV